MQLIFILLVFVPIILAQQYTTPVPILKQINKHNEDGSYSYGYEGADGSYKIETKYPNGEVYGKYGYIDDQGKLREVEYGATRRGFEPAGQDITVAPPTLTNNQQALRPLAPNEEDDGQYREDPAAYYKNDAFNSENSVNNNNVYSNRPSYQSFQSQNYQSQPVYTNTKQDYQEPSYQQPSYQQSNYQQSSYQQPSYQQPSYQQSNYQQPSYQQSNYQQPSYQQSNYQQPSYQQNTYQQPYRPQSHFNFNSQPQVSQPHPLTGVDYASGSYSVSY
ncbi:vacuolar protein-sorting-associated protein 36-like [Onthophagus taurus]|uniref:vacuolar protein-sorting-associated protein 36-like n=1 Tax=Onthophagus taurus TaxID=166361 RepID=UPI000C20E046|nr:drebrin-like protein [Onthophagus taurus]